MMPKKMSKSPPGKRRTFTEEYKAEVVRLCSEPGKTAYGVARELGLSTSMVTRWVKQAAIDRGVLSVTFDDPEAVTLNDRQHGKGRGGGTRAKARAPRGRRRVQSGEVSESTMSWSSSRSTCLSFRRAAVRRHAVAIRSTSRSWPAVASWISASASEAKAVALPPTRSVRNWTYSTVSSGLGGSREIRQWMRDQSERYTPRLSLRQSSGKPTNSRDNR